MKQLFTIGYAAFESISSFSQWLHYYDVDAIADVRSVPYSKFRPEFNKETLTDNLRKNEIKYVFLGDYCGARIDDLSCYVDGCVDYTKVKETGKFKHGIERIINGLANYNISLLCAEKDPLYCHRDILICRNLKSHNIPISHILAGGKLENNDSTEKRLLKIFKLDANELFLSVDEQLEIAYDRQGKNIAYKLQREEVID
jgi:uncharacterized protein (DUF488 family)